MRNFGKVLLRGVINAKKFENENFCTGNKSNFLASGPSEHFDVSGVNFCDLFEKL
jgi:hypothetical protein